SVFASWSAYSLNATAAISRAIRPDAFLGGTEHTCPSNIRVLCEVGQNWWVLYQPVCQITMAKFGKNWNDDRPHGCTPAGLMPGGGPRRSGLSHAPNSPLRVARSAGFTFSGGISHPRWSDPAVVTTPCGPSI